MEYPLLFVIQVHDTWDFICNPSGNDSGFYNVWILARIHHRRPVGLVKLWKLLIGQHEAGFKAWRFCVRGMTGSSYFDIDPRTLSRRMHDDPVWAARESVCHLCTSHVVEVVPLQIFDVPVWLWPGSKLGDPSYTDVLLICHVTGLLT